MINMTDITFITRTINSQMREEIKLYESYWGYKSMGFCRVAPGWIFERVLRRYLIQGKELSPIRSFGKRKTIDNIKFERAKEFSDDKLSTYTDNDFKLGTYFYPISYNWASLDSFGIAEIEDEVYCFGFPVTIR